jgi:trehalose 6-phosphate phosphatase
MLFLDKTEEDYAGWLARLNEASERLLILDYDGTLAPFVIERSEAIPYPGVVDLLESISLLERSRIIVVSGRNVEEVSKLLSMERPLELWGSHGCERMEPDGTITAIDPGEDAREGLTEALRILDTPELESRIERKHASIALHWRGLGETAVKELRDRVSTAWHDVADKHGLSVKSFDGGLEIVATGRDKGRAVHEILDGMASDSIAVYLGDDLTDEDAFKALRPKDLGILVNERLRPTAAKIWIQPPDELLDFLNSWIEACGAIQ